MTIANGARRDTDTPDGPRDRPPRRGTGGTAEPSGGHCEGGRGDAGLSDGPRESIIYSVTRAVFRFLFTLLLDLRIYGAKYVPHRGGLLLVANHESFLDPPVVACGLRRPISFLSKSELFGNKAFAWMIRHLNAFPVRQGEADLSAMREAIKRLKQGHALVVFPEGSRTFDGKLLPLQAGVAVMIRRAGVPVVPVVVDGTFEAWRRGTTFMRPYPVRVCFGPPMKLDGLRGEEIIQRIEQTFRQMLTELRSTPHPALENPKQQMLRNSTRHL